MNVMQICNKSPFPPIEGGSIAMKAIRDGLIASNHFVYTFALSTPKFIIRPEICDKIDNFSYKFLDTSVAVLPALKRLITNKSYHISRFYSKDIASEIKNIIKKNNFDLVLIESLYMMPYLDEIRSVFSGNIILRSHNLEHLIWERYAKNDKNIIRKLYLTILAKQLKKYETSIFLQVDGVAAISSIDAEIIQRLAPNTKVQTVPFAIEISQNGIKNDEFRFRFGHIGSMNWKPNIEGINYFLDNIWQKVKNKVPQATFNLAGRNMPSYIKTDEKKGIFVHGEVENSDIFMLSLDAIIVPLLSGSGVRIKIAEAMSIGVPIITTPVGAEGLMVKHRHDIFICETDEKLINTIIDCCNNNEFLNKIALEAKKTIQKYHSPKVVADKLIKMINFDYK